MRPISFAAMPTPSYDPFQSVTVSVTTSTVMGNWALDAKLSAGDAKKLAFELLRAAADVAADQP